jgi:two-component system alkaline phosphatase synthesis response regulator PhoP
MKKILIVDDEPGVRLTVNKMLENDYAVFEAANGEEAMNIINEQTPDLILMDLMMPKMDGYTACSKIKTHPKTMSIPVVILTSIGHELNKKFANEMGADGYITKPFTKQDLLSTVSQLVKNN